MNVVAHNMLAMFGERQFKINSGQTKKSQEKLSSGYRINRAADDAAGLAISEKMRYQIRGLRRGEKNAQDGISMLQVADGALSETMEVMRRITELSVQAANGTNSYEDRQDIQHEINQILAENERVFEETSFNGEKIFRHRNMNSIDDDKVSETSSAVDLPVAVSDPWVQNLSAYGRSTDRSIMNYVWDADEENGITINSSTYPWNTIHSSNGDALSSLADGRYHISYEGTTFSFDMAGAETLAGVAEALDGVSAQRWERVQMETVAGDEITPVVNQSVNVNAASVVDESLLEGRHIVSADESGISLDGGARQLWSDIGLDEETLSTGGNVSAYFGNGISYNFSVESGASLSKVAEALNRSSFEVRATGAATISTTSDLAAREPFSINVVWNNIGDPLEDDALKQLGVDSFPASLQFRIEYNADTIGSGSLYAGSDRVRYSLNADSRQALTDLINGRSTISQGESVDALSFSYGNSTMKMQFVAKRNFDSGSLDTGYQIATASIALGKSWASSTPSLSTVYEDVMIATTSDEYSISGLKEVRSVVNADDDSEKDGDTQQKREHFGGRQWRIQASSNATDFLMLNIGDISNRMLDVDGLDVRSEAGALDAIERSGKALEKLGAIRSKIGAQQNRLEHTIDNINQTAENTEAAESRIRDTEISDEMVAYLKSNMLEQVGQSMLVQANQKGESVLTILGG